MTDEAAVDALWPDAPPGRGAEQFHTAVGNLRKVLREMTERGETMFVEHAAGRYRIDPDLVEIDLWSFQSHLAQAERCADDDTERATALTAAAGIYRGDLAEGSRYDWAEALREQFAHSRLNAFRAHRTAGAGSRSARRIAEEHLWSLASPASACLPCRARHGRGVQFERADEILTPTRGSFCSGARNTPRRTDRCSSRRVRAVTPDAVARYTTVVDSKFSWRASAPSSQRPLLSSAAMMVPLCNVRYRLMGSRRRRSG